MSAAWSIVVIGVVLFVIATSGLMLLANQRYRRAHIHTITVASSRQFAKGGTIVLDNFGKGEKTVMKIVKVPDATSVQVRHLRQRRWGRIK